MRTSELIQELQQLLGRYGNLPVSVEGQPDDLAIDYVAVEYRGLPRIGGGISAGVPIQFLVIGKGND